MHKYTHLYIYKYMITDYQGHLTVIHAKGSINKNLGYLVFWGRS